MTAPALAHYGWTADELNIVRDMLQDGSTCASIGLRLNCSATAVTDMAWRSGIPVKRRGVTRQVQIHVRAEEHVVLEKYASERGLTMPTFSRIILELAAKNPQWIDSLLDDDRHIQKDAAEPPMNIAVKPAPAPVVEPSPVLQRPIAMLMQPMLFGNIGGTFSLTVG